jgi:hypothetical protein
MIKLPKQARDKVASCRNVPWMDMPMWKMRAYDRGRVPAAKRGALMLRGNSEARRSEDNKR